MLILGKNKNVEPKSSSISPSMNKILEVTELAIVIATPNYDPTLLHPSFLSGSGIIPRDWTLTQQPTISNSGSALNYSNGINLAATRDRVMFIESLLSKDNLDIPQIAHRYLNTLPNLPYTGAGLNFRGYISFSNEPEGARQYLFETFFASRPWQNQGTAPVQAGINLVFTFEETKLNLSINEAQLQLPEQEKVSVVLFTGNFACEPVSQQSPQERLKEIQQFISGWEENLDTYEKVVNSFVEETQTSELSVLG